VRLRLVLEAAPGGPSAISGSRARAGELSRVPYFFFLSMATKARIARM
jgi:hypothetical protein